MQPFEGFYIFQICQPDVGDLSAPQIERNQQWHVGQGFGPVGFRHPASLNGMGQVGVASGKVKSPGFTVR
jgi:hypothetical protein